MRPVKTALLSYGMSGQVFHAPFLHLNNGFQLQGSWERSKKQIEKDYPDTRSYDQMGDVLNDPEIELVIVNTPTFTHFEYARKVLEAGKHAIVEKAFTTNVDEARELRELADEKGLKLIVYQNRRWDSDFKTVQDVIEKGLIGKVVEASISFARYKPEISPKTHKEKPSPGAGIIKDLGAHVIDQALCLFGLPESVFADIRMTRTNSEVDDYFDILMKYPDKSVHANGGYFFREPTPEFAIHGTIGSFLKSRSDVQEDQLKEGIRPGDPGYGIESEHFQGLLHTEKNGEVVREKIPTHSGNYMDYYEAVYQCIRENKPAPVSAEDGLNVMKVIDAAFESQKFQKVVSL